MIVAVRFPIVLFVAILIATALVTKTALAGLGWTLEECKQHYGEPTRTQSHALGLMEYFFSVKDFIIEVETDPKGKVGYITHERSPIDDELATQLMQQNAPKATWELGSSATPNIKVWLGLENGTNKYFAMLTKDISTPTGTNGDAFTIGTYEFHLFKVASQKQEAKDQASGL
jgi:hypothetical protein